MFSALTSYKQCIADSEKRASGCSVAPELTIPFIAG